MATIKLDTGYSLKGGSPFNTTCPYCSAQCGQKVVVEEKIVGGVVVDERVLDIYGDADSPINMGGLCAKGAGAFQLVNNNLRLGVEGHTAGVVGGDGTDFTGSAWRRVGDKAWQPITLAQAMAGIASGATFDDPDSVPVTHSGMVALRGTVASPNPNSKNVMFFGCSHANNEPNYLYRKLIADFGTTNVEHQARI
jgi:formate dehydrogenase major subunit